MENKQFTYHLPQLGKLNVQLYHNSTKCFNLLYKKNHIHRLKNIDQLGVIRNVYEGAHHPRWEYVILQLNLINRLNDLDDAKGAGLSSNKNKFLNYNPSGAEILQIWVLLLNSGHLPGTFASERGLLRTLKESNKIRRIFLEGLGNQPKKRELLKQIIAEEDVYSIHKLLISFHLDRYKRYADENIEKAKFVNFLQEILDFYLFEPDKKNLSEKRKKLKSIFFRIRQISYLFLDTQYTPFPVNFDLSKIYLNFEDYYEDIFVESNGQMIKTLKSFDDLLSVSLYHAPDSISELGKHSYKIQKLLKNKDFSGILDIQEFLIGRSDNFKPTKFSDDDFIFQILFDLTIENSLNRIFKNYLCFNNEKKWNNLFGKNNCLLTFQSSPTGIHTVINLRIFKNSPIEKNMKILGHLLKNYVEYYFNIKDEVNYRKYETIDKVFQRPSNEIMLNILKYITRPELSFEFSDFNNELSVLHASGSKSAKKDIEKMDLDISEQRKHEIDALCGTLDNINYRGKLLISLSPILVYNHERRILTDLDGFALGFHNNNLKLFLVEAKDQHRSSLADSSSQLDNTLKKLDLKTSEKAKICKLKDYRCSFTYLTIDGKTV